MKKKNFNKPLLILGSFALIIFVFLIINTFGTRRLNPVEIREYQGQKLSSINDVIDNAINGTQKIDAETYNLTIAGLVKNTKSYTYDAVINNHTSYEKVVTLNCVEGWSATILWEGVLLKDLFNETGVDSKANTVIFYASDGYSTSLPLDYIINKNILLAYKMNGVTLPSEKGFPFQLVAESKYGYKWIKWITRIELSDNESYQGYWESRGYSNAADIK
jgi:DMSO/TMAO reductase YedYZ molybdopterin-dependent catalytic subunit